ncbi:MAG: hypothetical protein BWY86_00022 [Candidatus Aminicenantes bacterium ADurb.Bin508]|nr:MAG: hypothetical protein BWY86_00022 [Candidatus Aminicenantes bacterium ADurb.Bin508]
MDMTKLTGLWKNKDKEGNTFLSGNLNAITTVMVMPNTFKKDQKEPDYFMYIKPHEAKGDKKGNQGQGHKTEDL